MQSFRQRIRSSLSLITLMYKICRARELIHLRVLYESACFWVLQLPRPMASCLKLRPLDHLVCQASNKCIRLNAAAFKFPAVRSSHRMYIRRLEFWVTLLKASGLGVLITFSLANRMAKVRSMDSNM